MQGLLRVELAAFLFTPLIGASASPHVLLPAEQPDSLVATVAVIDHCSVGCPVGGDAVTLYRQAYALYKNGSTKFAKWWFIGFRRSPPLLGVLVIGRRILVCRWVRRSILSTTTGPVWL
ncbi:Nuclease precursor [compost metagenome]